MGKCEKIITKSAKKERVGNPCGIYTSKQIDGIYYCKAHYDIIKSKLEKQPEKENVVEEITLNNGYSLEEVMQKTPEVKRKEKRNVLRELLISMNDKLDTLLQTSQKRPEREKLLEEINKPVVPTKEEPLQFEMF